MTRTDQLQAILTPYIVSGTISKSVAVNILALMQLTENEKNEIIRTLRVTFNTARWTDYSAGTPHHAALQCLEKYDKTFKTKSEMDEESEEGNINDVNKK